MTTEVLDYLQKTLKQIELDRWGKRGLPRVLLSKDTQVDEKTGALKGQIEIYIQTRNGNLELTHTEDLTGVKTKEQASDHLSEALSLVLARHSSWPR